MCRRIDWSYEKLVPFKKDFYTENRKVAEMDKKEIKDWMAEKEVHIQENGKNKVD